MSIGTPKGSGLSIPIHITGTLKVELPIAEKFQHIAWFTNMIQPRKNYFLKISQRKEEGGKYYITVTLSGTVLSLQNHPPKYDHLVEE